MAPQCIPIRMVVIVNVIVIVITKLKTRKYVKRIQFRKTPQNHHCSINRPSGRYRRCLMHDVDYEYILPCAAAHQRRTYAYRVRILTKSIVALPRGTSETERSVVERRG